MPYGPKFQEQVEHSGFMAQFALLEEYLHLYSFLRQRGKASKKFKRSLLNKLCTLANSLFFKVTGAN